MTPEDEEEPVFSPDGRWRAYATNRSGRSEIYLPPGRIQRGRADPDLHRWRAASILADNSDEIVYVVGYQTMMAARIQLTSPKAPVPETPVELFRVRFVNDNSRPFTLSPDGQRFVVLQDLDAAPATAVVVQHWFDGVAEKLR